MVLVEIVITFIILYPIFGWRIFHVVCWSILFFLGGVAVSVIIMALYLFVLWAGSVLNIPPCISEICGAGICIILVSYGFKKALSC